MYFGATTSTPIPALALVLLLCTSYKAHAGNFDHSDDPHSIINAGDCKVRVNVQIFEHLCDGRIVQLPRRNPRVAVEVDVEVHLHHCPPMRR